MAANVPGDAVNGPPGGPERATWTERTNQSRTKLRQIIRAALASGAIDWQIEGP